MNDPVAGVVLASGTSSRFGAANKLLVPIQGVPVVVRTVTAYLAARLSPVVVVVGHDAGAIEASLSHLSVRFVGNPNYEKGMSRSLVKGVLAVNDARAAVIGVADQPLLSSPVICAMVDLYRDSGAAIVVPRYGQLPGNPVLFDRTLYPELLQVEGDVGGRKVVEAHMKDVVWLEVDDERLRLDIDTQADLEALSLDHDFTV